MKHTQQSGFVPLIIVLMIVVAGGATYAVVPRAALKEFFQVGDKPLQAEKVAPLNTSGELKDYGDKPEANDFADTIDSMISKSDDGLTDIKTPAKVVNPAKTYVAGDTAIKSEPLYQAKVLSKTEAVFAMDVVQPVTFKWTPGESTSQGAVTYRLKVWQLMQGQSGTQAMRTNQPIVTKDVDNITQVTVSDIYTGPCRPPYLCEFVWNVETMTKADTGASVKIEAETSVSGSVQ